MHADFVDLCEYVPGLRCEIRYATSHNLTGHPLAGYLAPKAVGTQALGDALRRALTLAAREGYGLLVYDAYRPQKAVQDFAQWSRLPQDGTTKDEFYPALEKNMLFPLGYIAARSGHSRGSVVDLTLTTPDGIPLDMGTCFDRMDELSHHGALEPDSPAAKNRGVLLRIMTEAGFIPYEDEWWHYRLENEPYPDTYFDFDIL